MRPRHLTGLAMAAVLAAACGGGQRPPAPGAEQTQRLDDKTRAASVYKSLGSLQCQGGGRTLDELAAELRGAGVQVLESSCGQDGRIHAAVCGAPDGRIGIFEVPEAQVEQSAAAGFRLLRELPDATSTSCS